MPEYKCLHCEYFTDRKSSYNKHMNSKSHMNKVNNEEDTTNEEESITMSICSIESNTTQLTENNTELIIQLELLKQQLKHNEEIYKKEIQIKDEIIKMKDEMIVILKQQTIQVNNYKSKEIKKKKLSMIEYIENNMKEAITIEEFMKLCYRNEEMNKQIEIIEDGQLIILKNIKLFDYDYKDNVEYYVKNILSIMDKLHMNKRPIICSDLRRHKFYVNIEKEGWKLLDTNEVRKIIWRLAQNFSIVISTIAHRNTLKLIENTTAFNEHYNYSTSTFLSTCNVEIGRITSLPMNDHEYNEKDKFIKNMTNELSKLVHISGFEDSD